MEKRDGENVKTRSGALRKQKNAKILGLGDTGEASRSSLKDKTPFPVKRNE